MKDETIALRAAVEGALSTMLKLEQQLAEQQAYIDALKAELVKRDKERMRRKYPFLRLF